MNILNLITDVYDRQARLYPALLLIAPAVTTVVTIFSEKITTLESAGSALLGFGGAFFLTQLARDMGKNREPMLFKEWGGMPSVLIFRHSNSRIDPITKARYKEQLAGLVKGTQPPTEEEEKADQRAADEVYIAWSQYLRVQTRDVKKFSLLFKENINYGYRRNVWGLRPIGISVSLLCAGISAAHLCFYYKTTGKIGEEIAGALVISFLFLVLWLFRFTSNWVRIPADAYAERLAEAVDVIGLEKQSRSKKAKS